MSIVWTPALDETLRRMWREGALMKEIAEATGTSRNSVYRRSATLRLGTHPQATKKRTMNEKTKAQLLKMRDEGFSVTEMSRAVKFSTSSVSRFLSNDGDRMPRYVPTHCITVPQSVLADRERRYQLEPRDLTAAIFGDPLPGMSALDRR